MVVGVPDIRRIKVNNGGTEVFEDPPEEDPNEKETSLDLKE